MNSVYNLLNSKKMSGNFGNMQNLLSQFNQFKNTFSGNPQEMVQKMLNNGTISQQQFNQVAEMANQFQKMIGK